MPLNPRGKNWTNYQNHKGTLDENKNSKVCIGKILLDSGASVLVVCNDTLSL